MKNPTSRQWTLRIVACGLLAASFLAKAAPCAAGEPPKQEAALDPAKEFETIKQLADTGKDQRAARELRDFIRRNATWPRLEEANQLLGVTLVRSGDLSVGREILDRIVQNAPEAESSASAYFYRGRAFEGLGDFPAAILSYDVLVRKFPKNELTAQAALDEAMLSEKVLQNDKRAREVYEFFIATFGNHPMVPAVHNHLGLLCETAGDNAVAVKYYREYAAKNPGDVGNPAINGGVAGAAPALWHAAELYFSKMQDRKNAIAAFQEYERLPRANKGQGFVMAARLAQQEKDIGDPNAFYQQSLAANLNPDVQLECARWLQGTNKMDEASKHYLALVANQQEWRYVEESLNSLGPERVRAYLEQNPGSLAIFRHYLTWHKDAEKRVEGRKALDQWLARNDIGWKTAIAKHWLGLTNDLEDCLRVAKAADAEGLMADSVAASLAAVDRMGDAPDKALATLTAALDTWAGYPDFPAGDAVARVVAIAHREPLTPPKPAEGQPAANQPAPAPADQIPAAARASRERAIEMIRKYKLDASPLGADAIAQLRAELDVKAAVPEMLKAWEPLVTINRRDLAAAHVAKLLKELPEHDAARVALLQQIAPKGPGGWEGPWKDVILPAADAELKFVEAANPQTEQTRLARTKLMLFFEANKSVAVHDEFLQNHAGSADAPAVMAEKFAEMRRAGADPTPVVLQVIKDLEKNPVLVRAIPVDMVPAGPDGYELYVKSLAKANAGDPNLGPDVLLRLALMHERFNKAADEMKCIRDVVGRYGATPQALEAKQAAIRIFKRGFFAPGVTQADAEQAFAWAMELCVQGQLQSFAEVSGLVWRLACHPAYRLHGLQDYDALYLYSAHGTFPAPKTANEFYSNVYASFPGDGMGPVEKAESGASPYAGGDKFLLHRWGLLRAAMDGYYHFWFGGDDWASIDIDGQPYNFPPVQNAYVGVNLSRGLHVVRIAFGDGGGASSMTVDWQPPNIGQRIRLGAEAFSSELYPIILSTAALNQGAAGLAQWDAYVQRFPRDARGRMMRLETIGLADANRGAGEFQKLAGQFPANLLYRQHMAECMWRAGRRDESLREYAALAARQQYMLWDASYNSVYKLIFLANATPVNFQEEYQDRLRAACDWATWAATAQKTGGDSGGLQARNAAEGLVTALDARAKVLVEAAGLITGTIAKEKAAIDAAKQLAAKADATEDVKGQATRAVARSTTRVAELEAEGKRVETKTQAAQQALAAFRGALGLAADQPASQVPIKFAVECLGRGSLDSGSLFWLCSKIWNTPDREACRPFLDYLVKYSTDMGTVAWCIDRLIELGAQGQNIDSAAATLVSMGMRQPRDGTHANALRRACDMTLQTGNVFLFARAAQVLAKFHPDNRDCTGYLDRLGEVFEKAGNFTSAEVELRRVIQGGRDEAQKRNAQLALARLYEKQGRSVDALKVLSALVKLYIPEQKKAGAPTPAVAPRPAPKEGEVPVEDTLALLTAARSYLSIELSNQAFDCYNRASVQKDFGTGVRPDPSLLFELARAQLTSGTSASGTAMASAPKGDDDKHHVLPSAVVERADKTVKLVDTLFRLYAKEMDQRQTVVATLLRADANIMMRNYPRAIEEIREAKKLAGDTPAGYLTELKMGELQLASDNADQALPVFRKLAKLNLPDVSPVALFWLGTTQLRLNTREDAIESFRVLWERYAENDLVRTAIYTIARTYAEQGAFLDAIRLYDAVGAIHSTPKEKVVPGDILTVKVWDADHYLGTGEYTIPVQIKTSCGDAELLLLDMNKINRSLFLGTIRTLLSEPNPGDGILQVYGTDMIYVTYWDRFKGLEKDKAITKENVEGERVTTLIQVVQDAEIRVSPTVFVEKETSEEDIYVEKTERELEEERRLAALSAALERGEAVVRPGNAVYVRVKDGDHDGSAQPDKISAYVYTYSPEQVQAAQVQPAELARQLTKPMTFEVSDTIPSNGEFAWRRVAAPPPGSLPRLDGVKVELTETGPHTGIFYGTVKTAVNGPTAIASDTSGDNIAALALDGSNKAADAWMGFIDAKPGKWLEVDLKELYSVTKIVWDRGEGADDRFMIDYNIVFRGQDAPVTMEFKGNKSAHNNVINLEKPATCRWVRLLALTYDSDAPAISHIEIYDDKGNKIVPSGTSPVERTKNDVLEFNVGDCMSAEILDEENMTPGRSVKRVANPLGVAYVDGHIDAVYLSRGKNEFLGSILLEAREEKDRVWARRTKRVKTDDVLQIAVIDPDLDVDANCNTVQCEVTCTSGDSATLEAKEIDSTAAVFTTRLQLSPMEAAKADDNRLWVRPGDFIKLRYLDEQNRDPGHAIYRESYVFAADDEVADFAQGLKPIESPQHKENDVAPPNWVFALREPDQALPRVDRTEMSVQSLTTDDNARFTVLLRDLDGNFSSRVPVAMSDKPHVELPKDADPAAPRRIRALDEWAWWSDTRDRRGSEMFDIPLAVSGDDLVWMSYKDATPRAAAGRVFVPIAPATVLEKLQKLGVRTDQLPQEAVAGGLEVEVKDPLLKLAEARKQRDEQVMREIARKSLQCKKLIARYEETLTRIGGRIKALTAKEAAPKPKPEAAAREAEAIEKKEAPLTNEEASAAAEGIGEDELLETEDLIRAAALRRDRDALNVGVEALKARLKRLESLVSGQDREKALAVLAKAEAEVEKADAELRAKLKAEAEKPVKPLPPEAVQVPAPWYTEAEWWKNCGGLIPGVTLKIRVNDRDLPKGVPAKVLVAALGQQPPRYIPFEAKPVDGKPGVFELALPTTMEEGADGALCLKGTRSILVTYEDTAQEKFSEKREACLSLASNARLDVTGPDFLETKESFHVGEEIYVIVRDSDVDKTGERDFVWVTVTTDQGDRESLPVRESQPHSGVFRGSIRSEFAEAKADDGFLQGKFGGTLQVEYVDELWRSPAPVSPVLVVKCSFVAGTDGTAEIFARQLKHGALQRDVLFSTGLAEYELGNSATEMGALQRGRSHLLAARERFHLLLEQYPDDPICAHATYYLGNIYFLLGNFAEAVQSLQEVIDRWPKSEFKAKALYKLGTCHMKAGEMDKAIESFVNLAYHHADSPLVADSMLTLAQHFSSQKHYRSSIGVGEAFIRKFPDHAKTGNMYLRLAGWLMVEKRYAVAIEHLEDAEKTLPESPNMPAFLYWHAECIFKTAGVGSVDYKRAIVLLQRITFDYADSKYATYAAARLAERDVTQ